MELHFIKLHGAGNDFIFLDLRSLPGSALVPAEAARLCHRQFGIGADGIIALVGVDEAGPRMRIYNSDGTIPEMCGNGIRCFVKVMQDHFGSAGEEVTVATDAGLKLCRCRRQGEESLVTVAMGAVSAGDGSPMVGSPAIERLTVGGLEISFVPVSTGNPHAVVLTPLEPRQRELVGPSMSLHPRFPQGTNVGFLAVKGPTELDLVVCERGVGFTLACGTGAVAASAVAVALGRAPAERPLLVHLPGGDLRITIGADYSWTLMEGPAREVYRGIVSVAA